MSRGRPRQAQCRARQWAVGCATGLVLAVGSRLMPAAADGPAARADAPLFRWEKRGAAAGRPLIFLPAIGFPGSTWAGVYSSLEDRHPIVVVTFAGSDGLEPAPPPLIPRYVEALAARIATEKLDGAVIVGHLLGAHVGLRLAGQYPDRVAGVFAIPVLAALPPPAMRAETGRLARQMYLDGDEVHWDSSIRMDAIRAAGSPESAERLLAMLRRADRATYAELMGEMMSDVLEEWLVRIRVPVFLLAPVTLPREAAHPDLRVMKPSEYARVMVDGMCNWYPGIERCDTGAVRNTRRFAIDSNPDLVRYRLESYLKKLEDPGAKWGTTRRERAATRPGDSIPPPGTQP